MIDSITDKINALDPVLHRSLIEALKKNLNLNSHTQNQDKMSQQYDSQMFEKAFQRVVIEIKANFITGTIDFIEKYHPVLYDKTILARDKIDDVWKRGRKGEASIEEFNTALSEWKSLHLKAIEIFKEESKRFI